jgi:hypothetical protein
VSSLENEVVELQTLTTLLSAEVAALQSLLSLLHPEHDGIGEIFLQIRKQKTQQLLEQLENTNPARAARIQRLLDAGCTHLPIDYES